MKRYSYFPVNSHNNEIRILNIFPGRRGYPICCSLTNTSIGSFGYTALSYTWGSTETIQLIEIYEDSQKYSLAVTDNLYEALDHIRSQNTTQSLWVDAICINQADTGERNCQVRLMRQIYSSASRLLIWLGKASEDSDSAMRLFRACSEPDYRLQVRQLSIDDSSAITALFGRPWFKRLWTRQEVRVSTPELCQIQCGDFTLGLSAIMWFRQKWFQSVISEGVGVTLDERKVIEYVTVTEALSNLVSCIPKDFPHGNEVNSLGYWLEASVKAQTTDPRDHVFAVLGMTDYVGEQDLLIDYSKSVAAVFAETIIFDISRSGN